MTSKSADAREVATDLLRCPLPPKRLARATVSYGTGAGKTETFLSGMLARIITDVSKETGISRREILLNIAKYSGLSVENLRGSGAVRLVDPAMAFLVDGASTDRWLGPPEPIDPAEALVVFLQRLLFLGRRADVSRQLAIQRLKLAFRAARSSPDVPPGEVVVSSARVPRGPDSPRVTSAVVDHSR